MANDREAPAENFKRALTLAMKTIAQEPELTCSFGAEHPGITDKRARLPQVTRDATAADLAVTRGLSDAMAMRLANHSASVHSRYLPQGQQARTVYEAIEQARVEALGDATAHAEILALGAASDAAARGSRIVISRRFTRCTLSVAARHTGAGVGRRALCRWEAPDLGPRLTVQAPMIRRRRRRSRQQ